MSKLDSINAGLDQVQAAVNDVKAKVDAIKANAVSDADVQATADKVAAISASVSAIV